MILVVHGKLVRYYERDYPEDHKDTCSYVIEPEAFSGAIEDGNLTLFVNDLIRPGQFQGLDAWSEVTYITVSMTAKERGDVPVTQVSDK